MRGPFPRTPVALCLIGLLTFVGCARKEKVPAAIDAIQALNVQPTGEGPCALLAREEVELALNTGLASVQPAGRPILSGMRMCAAGKSSAKPTTRATWGILAQGARDRFERYRRINDDYLEGTSVRSHRALWDRGLNTLTILIDDKALGIRIFTTEREASSRDDRLDYHQKAARALARRALTRL